jgi:uncharacterized protein (DUF1697 family)
METYIAVLRGINVSGKNIIKIKALAVALENAGLSKVKTYIQSGNIVFCHQKVPLGNLRDLIHTTIIKNFSYEVPVIVFTKDYLKRVIQSNPFLNQPDIDMKRLFVTFFAAEPENDAHEAMLAIDLTPDKILRGEKAYYGYCPGGYATTKFNNDFFEKKAKVKATTRNWRTCNKLLEIADSFQK